MIISNFYDAAFLLQEGYSITQIDKDERGKTQYHFAGGDDLIQIDLDEFHDNRILQEYISKGIVKLRKINRKNRNKWKRENSTVKKRNANLVSEA